MFLLGSRLKGLSVRCPFPAPKVPISDDRAEEILPDIVAGCASAADEFIRGMAPLALCIVGQYAKRRPRDADELVSAALFGLTKTISTARNNNLKNHSIKAWAIGTIHGECSHHFEGRRTFGPCGATIASDPEKAISQIPYYIHTEALGTIYAGDSESIRAFCRLKSSEFTFRDVVEAADKVLVEPATTVFNMRKDGWEIQDIAVALGEHHTKIYRIWQSVREKIIRALNEEA